MAEEFGDLLFVMANIARYLGVDPEASLRDANANDVVALACRGAIPAPFGKLTHASR